MNSTLKTCFKCGREKPRTEFYRHARMGDGLLGKCKECTKADALTRSILKSEQVRAYDRERSKLPHRKAGRKSVQERYPAFKKNAANKIRNAVKNKRIDRKPCVICWEPMVEGHHFDYSKPKEVVWLCKPHHRQLHANRFSLFPNPEVFATKAS